MIKSNTRTRLACSIVVLFLLPTAFWGCAGLPAGETSASSPTSSPSTRSQVASSDQAKPQTVPAPPQPYDAQAVARIRDEGLNRSQVVSTLSYLSDVIGPRLTGSPTLKRANEWTRDKLTAWGLDNAHLEAWGPFGRGWSVKRFSAEVIEPQEIPLIAFPKAWSPGFDQPLVADVVLLDAHNPSELDAFSGKLEGKIVLLGDVRTVQPHFSPDGTRYTDEELANLANPPEQLVQAARGGRGGRGGRGPTSNPFATANFNTQMFNFAARQNPALLCVPSSTTDGKAMGDGGTMFVQSANAAGASARGPTTRVWAAEPPPVPPQITLAAEHYNRLVRMLQAGEKVRMSVNLQVEFNSDDPMAYNTIAEIPGTDLKDQIVMLGGHLDSWHSGTGATDNGAGVACAMEAVRIIKALGLKPRRTIRIALWSGEEEGLFGSAAYVKDHFGQVQGGRGFGFVRISGGGTTSPAEQADTPARGSATAPSTPRLTRGPEYDKLSVYFNLDNGAGKIRGIYAQRDAAAVPIFKAWLAPFADLGATTVAAGNTGSTDHISFDNIGLPGFQFIQDWLEYMTRTHHSNMDVFDRIQPDDLKQAATIMAAFTYNAAMMDQKMPRKMAN